MTGPSPLPVAPSAATPLTRVPRSPIIQAAVLIAMALLVGALVFNGGSSSSAEAYVISSAAHAAHIRHLSQERRRRVQENSRAARPPSAASAEGHHVLDRVTVKLPPHRTAGPEPLRWLAIGDSITQGLAPEELRRRPTRRTHPTNGTCGYLSVLGRELNDIRDRGVEGATIQFVGQFDEAHLGPYPTACMRVRHCATWGITAASVTSNERYKPTYRPLHLSSDGMPRDSLSRGARVYDWVRQHRPDVVSVLLGTNDLAAGTTNGALVDDLLRPLVLQALRAAEDGAAVDRRSHADARRWEHRGKCDAVVVVVLLLSRADGANDEVASVNEKLERRDRRWLQDKCVEVVSAGDGIDAHDPTHMYDGLHPGPRGEAIIAANILRELTKWGGSAHAVPTADSRPADAANSEKLTAAPALGATPRVRV